MRFFQILGFFKKVVYKPTGEEVMEFEKMKRELFILEHRILSNKGDNEMQKFADKCCYQHALSKLKNTKIWQSGKVELPRVLTLKI